MAISCLFCNNDVTNDGGLGFRPTPTLYKCHRCGYIHLIGEAADVFDQHFSNWDKKAISIVVRNEYERKGGKNPVALTFEKAEQIAKQYNPLDPLEKMDYALSYIDKSSYFVGDKISIDYGINYPRFHCFDPGELRAILTMLYQEGFIQAPDRVNPQNDLAITAKGYQRLREIKKPGGDSKQCFVAMWFKPELNGAYEEAIKPAIEFTEDGEDSPRFEAVKIDNVEHVNDINDEIVAQIRRSRFMVCDLTGYRGGVYFEAGFAYGLGLDVIYTCREDWTKEEILKDKAGNDVTTLYDNSGNEIQIKKEGVHFDLAHRNRIVWSPDDLEDFRVKLENRIKAVII